MPAARRTPRPRPRATSEIAVWLGPNLRRLRESRGLSIADLARAIPCHMSHITRAETGAYVPGGAFLWRAATVLGCSVDEIVMPPEQQTTTLSLGQRIDRVRAAVSGEELAALELLIQAVVDRAEHRARQRSS